MERPPYSAVLWWVAAALAGAGCRGATANTGENQPQSSASSPPAVASVTTPVAAAAPPLPPLGGVGWLEPLSLGGEHVAYVAAPVGAREARPLMVAVHGAGDRPEWACGGWRLAAQAHAFVVCPRGLPMDAQRFAWDGPRTIAERVQASLAAVRTRFGAYVAEGPAIYLGFSQGATMASAALLDEQARFPAVALAEGGYNLMRDARFLARLRERGTAKVLIVCGSPACFSTAKAVTPNFTRAGIELLTAGDPRSGHNLNQRMQIALKSAWPAFVRGLPNWSAFEARAAVTP